MAIYIDADVARRIISSPRSKEQMLLVLSQVEPADVVEVVRCKDCKWYGVNEVKKDGTIDMRYKPSFCYLYNKSHEEFYFCADGERREDENRSNI